MPQFLLYFMIFCFMNLNLQAQTNDTLSGMLNNKNKYPPRIAKEIEEALSFYPELQDVHIEFKFRRKPMKSFMQAQPKFGSLLRRKSKRKYVIQIAESFKINDQIFCIDSIPSKIIVGWLGHELGHVYDYLDRSTLNLLAFGTNYIFSKKSVKTTERSADINAIMHGMGQYIFDTRSFILARADLPEKYKQKIINLYLSPPEILELIENHDKKEIKTMIKSGELKEKFH